MSEKIDTYVAQAKFNNEGFEKNARDTIETLDELDQSFAKLYKHDGKNAFSGLANGIKETSGLFKQLSKIGEGALQKIGWDGIDFIRRNMTSLFKEATGMNNMIAGWSKYGQEVESVQTIMNATGKSMDEVQASLDKISWFTDETSYQYDAMVANIGRFNAAGVSLEDAEQTMLGIASAAGYFGVSATKATHAMSGFATAIGKGKMDRLSWQWIETAGMNVAGLQEAFMETAAEMGQLVKVGDKTYRTLKGNDYAVGQFKNSLSESWLTTEVMTKTLNKYSKSIDTIYDKYEEFGGTKTTSDIIKEFGSQLDQTSVKAFAAAQEAKTFREAWDSVTVAIQSKWRESFRLIIGNYEQAKKLWTAVANELYDVFAASGDVRNELLKGWNEEGGRDSLMRAFANFWYGLKAIMDTIKETWDKIFPPTTVKRLVEITNKFEDFSYKFRSLFDVEAAPFVEDIKSVGEAAEKVVGPVAKTAEVLDDLARAVINGDYGNGVDVRREKLEKLGYSFELVQNRVNALMNELYGTNYDPNYYTVPADKIVESSEEVVEAVEETKKVITEVAEIDPALLGGFRVYSEEEQKLVDQHEKAAKNTERISNIFGGLLAVVKMVGQVFGELRKRAGELLHAAFGGFVPVLEKVVDWLSDIGLTAMNIQKTFDPSKWVDNAFVVITESIGWASEKLGQLLVALIDFARVYVPRVVHWLSENFGGFFTIIGGWLKSAVDTITTYLPTVLDWIVTNVQSFWDTITKGQGIKRLGDTVKGLFDALGGLGLAGFEKVKGLFNSLFGSDSEEKIDVGKALADAIDFLADRVSDFLELVGGAGEIIANFFGSFKTKKEDTGAIEFVADTLENTGSSIEKASANIGKLKPISDFFENLSGYFTTITNFLRDPLAAFGKAIDNYAEKIGDFFSNLTLEGVGEKLKGGFLGAFLLILAKKLTEGAGAIASIPRTFVGILSSIKDVLFAYQQNLNGYALMTTAKAIGLLTLSIIGLSFVDSDKLTDVAVSLSAVIMMFAFAVKAMAGLRDAFNRTFEKKNEAQALENEKKALENVESSIKEQGDIIDKLIKGITDPIENFRVGLNASIDKKLNANNWAKGLLIMAVALGILWHQVITPIYNFFSTAPEVDQQRMLEVVGIVSVVMIGFSAIMAIANHFSGKATFGTAFTYVGVASAMWLLLKSLDPLKDYSPNQISNIQNVLVGLAVMVASLGGAVALMTKFSYTEKFSSKTWNSIYGPAQTANDLLKLMLGLAATILLMMPAFKVIGGMQMTELGKVGLVFVGLLLTMTGIVKMTNKLRSYRSEEIKKRFDAIRSVLVTMTGLIALMTGIGAVAGIDGMLEAWGRGLIVMGVSLAAFLGAGYLLEKIPTMADGLEKLAKAFLTFSGAILASIAAFYLLGKVIPSIMDGIAAVGERLQDPKFMANFEKAKPVIIKAFLILLGAFATAFVMFKTGIFKQLTGIGSGILSKISTFLGGDFSSTLKGLFTSVLSGIGKWLGGGSKWFLGLKLVALFVGALMVLETFCPGISDKLIKTFVRVIHSVADAIGGNASEIVSAVGHLAKALAGLLSEALHQALGGLGDLLSDTFEWDWLSEDAQWRKDFGAGWDRFTNWLTGKNDKVNDQVKENITGQVSAATGSFNRNMGTMNRSIGDKIDDVANTVQNGAIQMGEGFDLMTLMTGNSMGVMTGNISGGMTDMTSYLAGGTENMTDIYSMFNTDVGENIDDFDAMFGQMPEIVQTNMDATVTNMQNGTNAIGTMFGTDIPEYVNEYKQELENAASSRESIANGIIESHNQKMAEMVRLYNPIPKAAAIEGGREVVHGFSDGIGEEAKKDSTKTNVKNAISRLAGLVDTEENQRESRAKGSRLGRQVSEGYAEGIGSGQGVVEMAAKAMVNVAADVTARTQMSQSPSKLFAQFGLYGAQGYALGMEQNSYLAGDAAEGMVKTSMDKVRDAISYASEVFAQDWEDGPVITPVLNLADIQSGVGTLNRLTSGASMNISGRIGEIYTPKRTILDKLATLDSAVSNVNASLATSGNSMLTVEVPLYMDSKEVAHATAPIVNADIERMQRNAMRRAGKR